MNLMERESMQMSRGKRGPNENCEMMMMMIPKREIDKVERGRR